jgi:hypothetical protein
MGAQKTSSTLLGLPVLLLLVAGSLAATTTPTLTDGLLQDSEYLQAVSVSIAPRLTECECALGGKCESFLAALSQGRLSSRFSRRLPILASQKLEPGGPLVSTGQARRTVGASASERASPPSHAACIAASFPKCAAKLVEPAFLVVMNVCRVQAQLLPLLLLQDCPGAVKTMHFPSPYLQATHVSRSPGNTSPAPQGVLLPCELVELAQLCVAGQHEP